MNMIMENKVSSDFVSFTIKGNENFNASLKSFAEIKSMCEKNNCDKVLILKEIRGQLTMYETYKLFKQLSIIFDDQKVAIVDLMPVNIVLNDFGENVMTSFNARVKIFYDEDKAKKWLLSDN